MTARPASLDAELDELPSRGNCFDSGCAAREVLGHVTGRWGALVLAALTDGTKRFSELRARIDGISEKMLAQRLRELERDGLLVRRQYPHVPPRVEYTLTPAGREVAQRLSGLIGWLEDHLRDFIGAHQAHERLQDSEASGAQSGV
jgi:DNA-binding HxlR family transcriptional regulator